MPAKKTLYYEFLLILLIGIPKSERVMCNVLKVDSSVRNTYNFRVKYGF